MSTGIQQLAIDGGHPVRTLPLPTAYLGASVLGHEEMELLAEVVGRKLPFREYGEGEPHMVKDLERETRDYFGTRCALATATGSGSFFCALAGLGVGPGDEVIIPAFGWYTNYCVPVLFGATPVFADIDRSLCMDPGDFENKITPDTKAVMVVHFQGATNDMDRFLEIARRRDVKVLEDCAQACGASYKGRKLGSLGDVGCLSFQQNKILCTGDGGMLITDDCLLFERAVRYHDLGGVRPSLAAQIEGELQGASFAGCQFRMNEFTGAVGLAQLRKLDVAILDISRRHHRYICDSVAEQCPDLVFRSVGDPEGDAGIALYMDMVTSECGKWFSAALTAEGIRVGPSSGCTNLLHQTLVQERQMAHPAMPPFGPGWPGETVHYSPDLCPNTDHILASMVCVAVGPQYTTEDTDEIVKAIVKVWRSRPSALFDC